MTTREEKLAEKVGAARAKVVARVLAMMERDGHIGRAESELSERGEYSWVVDIRARVDVARGEVDAADPAATAARESGKRLWLDPYAHELPGEGRTLPARAAWRSRGAASSRASCWPTRTTWPACSGSPSAARRC